MSDEKPSLSPRKEKSPQSESSEVRDEKLQALLEKLNLQLEGEPGSPSVDGGKRVHNFWSTQPVPQKPDSVVKKDSPIHPDLPFDEIRKEPIDLPNGMHWCAVDVNSDEEIMELYNLLTENYVEDVDSMFRFDYSSEFLHWALKPPGWRKEWHVGIRYNETGRLIAFISAIPLKLKVRETTKQMVEINFLCVLKNLRKIGLSPTLIKEVTRRVNLTGTFQAVYTAGIKIPTPVSCCRYYHRTLNLRKLISTGFSSIPFGMTMHHAEMRLRLPQKPYLSIRDMRKGDEPQVRKLLNRFLKATSDLLPEFQNDDEVSHWFFPKDRVVWTYVVEDPTRPNKLTDFVSFYSLPSSVLKSKGSSDSSQIKAAYLFYYATNPEPEVELTDKDVASSEGSTKKKKTLIKERQIALVKQRLVALVGDALIKARDAGFDVFNCINLLRNELFLEDLKFSKGDGLLYYYLYNWQTRGIDASRIGLVML